MAELSVSATASLIASGNTTATGTISWDEPALPEGISAWDLVKIDGSWAWNGKGNISYVTINGTRTSNGIPFSIPLDVSVSSPLSISCLGNNKNAVGDNFTWTGLTVTYSYTAPLSVKTSGEWVPVRECYKKIGGVWVLQEDLSNVFDGEHYIMERR